MSSIPPPTIKEWTCEHIKTALRHNPSSVLLVDVREPHEHAAGTIPTAISLPLSAIDSWSREADCPGNGDGGKREVIFFCERGVRARRAAEGVCGRWRNIGVYPGSMCEWRQTL